MSEDILKGIRKWEGIHISESELDMRIDDELGQTQNFTAQVEGIPKTRLFPLLCCERPGMTVNTTVQKVL